MLTKHVKHWLVVAAVLLCSIPVNAQVIASGSCGANLTWTLNYEGLLSIRGTGLMTDYSYYGGAPWNNYKSLVKDVKIEEGVTSIGAFAFKEHSIVSFHLPESIVRIGDYAFDESNITSIYITSVEAWCNISFYCSYPYCHSNPLKYASHLYLNGELITELIIPDTITEIKSYAFFGCHCLSSITIPKSVTDFGDRAFSLCSGELVVNCNIPSVSQEWFEDYAPFSDIRFSKIIFGDDVTTIGDYAIHGYDSNGISQGNLCSLVIGPNVTSIGYLAFSGCSLTKTIWKCGTLPDRYSQAIGKINYISNSSYSSYSDFKIYPYLSSMFEVEGVVYVPVNLSGERTCDVIDSKYNSSSSIINIGETVSYKNIALRVEEINPYAFCNNDYIEDVYIANNANVGSSAFFDCDKIQTVSAFNYGNIGRGAFSNCDNIQSVTIANQGDVEYQAFYDCDKIQTVAIANQGSIGNGAFRSCDALNSVNIAYLPESGEVEQSTIYTFADWTSTNHSDGSSSSETYTFTVEDGFSLFFEWAVSSEVDYDKLMVILDGVTILTKSGSISGSHSKILSAGEHTLVMQYAKDNSRSYGNDQAIISSIRVTNERNVISMVGRIGNDAFRDCVALSSVTLGSGVSALGSSAFKGCSSLETIILPENVLSVGNYAFEGCSKLMGFILPTSVTSVGYALFSGCNALENLIVAEGNTVYDSRNDCNAIVETVTNTLVAATNATTIPNSLTKIGEYAFNGCKEIVTISIPKEITTIGDYAFLGCSKLADVTIDDRSEPLTLGSNGSKALFADCPLNTVYIGGKITYDTSSNKGYSPFCGSTSLTTVTISSKEKEIYDYEFYGCTALKDVSIGHGVTTIGNYAFSNCSSLEKFAFGVSVNSIGTSAFAGCSKMTEIVSSAGTPPTCGSMALDDIDKWNCTLKVPTGYMEVYATADQWKEFLFVEDIVKVARHTITYYVDGEVYHSESLIYDETIVLPEAPTKEGHTFVEWGDIPTKMPDENLEVHALFTPNSYTVTFKANDVVLSSESLTYGSTIVAPAAPEVEGYTFVEWAGLLTAVPAHDVEFVAEYRENVYIVEGIILSQTNATLIKGETLTLIATVTPANATDTSISWSSSNTNVATVDNNGRVTAVASGNATITATANDGSGASASCEITIEQSHVDYVTITINQYGSGTYSSEYALDFSEVKVLKAYVATGYNHLTGEVTLLRVHTAEAGMGLLVKGTPGVSYEVPILESTADHTLNMLVATLEKTKVNGHSDDGVYANYKYTVVKEQSPEPLFYQFADGASLSAGKAYLQIPVAWLPDTGQKSLRYRFDEGETTDIEDEEIINHKSEIIYDLMGRRVLSPKKGEIYIINNQKVVY